jgi:hypothetical protein
MVIFNDKSFFVETLRALGYAPYGGADIGEVTSTAGRIPDGDEAAWYSEWRALAERAHADRSAAACRRLAAACCGGQLAGANPRGPSTARRRPGRRRGSSGPQPAGSGSRAGRHKCSRA